MFLLTSPKHSHQLELSDSNNWSRGREALEEEKAQTGLDSGKTEKHKGFQRTRIDQDIGHKRVRVASTHSTRLKSYTVSFLTWYQRGTMLKFITEVLTYTHA